MSNCKVKCNFHTFGHVTRKAHHLETSFQVQHRESNSILLPMAYQLVTFWMTLNLTFKVKGHVHKFGPVTQEWSYLRDNISISTPILLPIAIQMDTFFMILNLTLRLNGKVEGHFHTFGHVTQEGHHIETLFQVLSILSPMASVGPILDDLKVDLQGQRSLSYIWLCNSGSKSLRNMISNPITTLLPMGFQMVTWFT